MARGRLPRRTGASLRNSIPVVGGVAGDGAGGREKLFFFWLPYTLFQLQFFVYRSSPSVLMLQHTSRVERQMQFQAHVKSEFFCSKYPSGYGNKRTVQMVYIENFKYASISIPSSSIFWKMASVGCSLLRDRWAWFAFAIAFRCRINLYTFVKFFPQNWQETFLLKTFMLFSDERKVLVVNVGLHGFLRLFLSEYDTIGDGPVPNYGFRYLSSRPNSRSRVTRSINSIPSNFSGYLRIIKYCWVNSFAFLSRLVILHPLLRAPHYMSQALSFRRREMRSSIPGFY